MGVPKLDDCHRQFVEVAERAEALTKGLSEKQFTWRPAANAWSIQECLAHLVMVGQTEVRLVEAAIQSGRSRGMTGNGPFRYGWLERTILRQTEPPSRRKFSSPRRFRPVHGQPVTAILPTFLHVQRQFTALAEQAKGLDLARIKVPTPMSRLVKFSLGLTLAQAAAHERRHLEQARAVRENPGFPS